MGGFSGGCLFVCGLVGFVCWVGGLFGCFLVCVRWVCLLFFVGCWLCLWFVFCVADWLLQFVGCVVVCGLVVGIFGFWFGVVGVFV